MTDEEIEKRLYSVQDNKGCCEHCFGELAEDALDYIHRLKAENEKIKDTLNAIENDEINLRGNLEECLGQLEQIRKDTAKEFWK